VSFRYNRKARVRGALDSELLCSLVGFFMSVPLLTASQLWDVYSWMTPMPLCDPRDFQVRMIEAQSAQIRALGERVHDGLIAEIFGHWKRRLTAADLGGADCRNPGVLEALISIYKLEGYLVLSFPKTTLESWGGMVGMVFSGIGELEQPFVVHEAASARDALRQRHILRRLSGQPLSAPLGECHYHAWTE
jgi:hypothetical protein